MVDANAVLHQFRRNICRARENPRIRVTRKRRKRRR